MAKLGRIAVSCAILAILLIPLALAAPTPTAVVAPIAATPLSAQSQNCVQQYECRGAPNGQNYYGCYYDTASKSCHCYIGSIDKCTSQDNRCAFEFECKPSAVAQGYNYDCSYNTATKSCSCYTGDFSECRQAYANQSAIIPPAPKEQQLPVMQPAPENKTAANASAQAPAATSPAPSQFWQQVAIVAIALIIIAAFIILSRRKEGQDSLLRKARDLHRRAEEAHQAGDENEARGLLADADALRRKALRARKR